MLNVTDISFSYGTTKVINNISFRVKKGENIAIIGESGSGKSTLLKLLFGEFDLDKGSITWNKKQILGPKFNLIPGYGFMKYVSQDLDLMPFTTVEENIGKFLSSTYPIKKRRRIKELIELFDLTPYTNIKVKFLSGGQKQLVSLARALAITPKIILLDEPFGHIDTFKKHRLRMRLFNYLKQNKITCILATHDKDDVLGYADSMLVLSQGKIEFSDKPEMLYFDPKSPLVASFFGDFNVINGELVYAHQLKAVDRSSLEVFVRQCYFKGTYYLIEAYSENQTIFFNHPNKLKPNHKICLAIEK